jgi:hypothetical protein
MNEYGLKISGEELFWKIKGKLLRKIHTLEGEEVTENW